MFNKLTQLNAKLGRDSGKLVLTDLVFAGCSPFRLMLPTVLRLNTRIVAGREYGVGGAAMDKLKTPQENLKHR